MKVIKPLFLDELYENFKKSENNPQKLIDLLNRLGKIKIFDPACGSGNFLIIAYKELRKLEMKVIHRLLELQKIVDTFSPKDEQFSFIPKSQLALAASFQVDLFSRIQLNQFYGIEIDDFAHEIAKLSLWLAEHQMNVEFLKEFGKTNPTLPLKEAGKIVCANATRIDWEKVCPKEKDDEIYILGNPPYLGARFQDKWHKTDIDFSLKSIKGSNNLDYIAIWFYTAAIYCKGSDYKFSFVTTNSIFQGSQVPILWEQLFNMNLEIFFAHSSFKWTNNAKGNAGVVCAIVGISNKSIQKKKIFSNGLEKIVENISPYLTPNSNTVVKNRNFVLSNLPKMVFGSMPNDGGYLLFEKAQMETIKSQYPELMKFVKKLIGSIEFIRGIDRYCFWFENCEETEIFNHPYIQDLIAQVKSIRLNSKRMVTKKLASSPHLFGEIRHKEGSSIIIPSVSSERREYIPMGFLSSNTIISNLALVIYDAEAWILGLLMSKIHMIWVKSIGGYLGTSIRYSISVCYNTFPFPQISNQRKQELNQTTFRILEEREKHSDKTLAELYDPDKMPDGLREAHHLNDLTVERCYRSKPFESDEERLEYLFKLYEQMIEEEKERDTLFAKEKRTRKKKK